VEKKKKTAFFIFMLQKWKKNLTALKIAKQDESIPHRLSTFIHNPVPF